MNCKILVVDDEERIGIILTKFLSKEGFEVVVATDGENALRIAKEQLPDLIVLDVVMPGMDGGDVMAGLANDDELKRIPVVLLTGLISEDETAGFNNTDYGGKVVLSKSLDIKEQVDVIKRVLGFQR